MTTVSYDQAVPYYDETRGYPDGITEQIRDAIVRITTATSSTQFLELAIGTGLIGVPFIQAGYDYHGVDISIPMMTQIHPKLADNAPRPKLAQANITQSFPFPDNTFDVINAIRVFHLLTDWQQAVLEAKRVLRPNGYLLIGRDIPRNGYDRLAPPHIVHQTLDDILETFGISSDKGVWRLSNETLIDYLQTTDATIEVVDLFDFDSKPFTARLILERHQRRIYSRYWNTPDAIHRKAMKQLRHWLDNEYPEPDVEHQPKMVFRAIVARWET